MMPPAHTHNFGLFQHRDEGRTSAVREDEIDLFDDKSSGHLEHNAEVINRNL